MRRNFAKTISLMLVLSIFISIPAWAETETTADTTPTTDTEKLTIEQYQFQRGSDDTLVNFSLDGFTLLPAVGDNTEVISSTSDYNETGSAYYSTAQSSDIGLSISKSWFWPDSLKNYKDDIVVVKNTGTESCYFRTFIAVEAPEGAKKLVLNKNEYDYHWQYVQNIRVDAQKDTTFDLYVATYTDSTTITQLDGQTFVFPSEKNLEPGNCAPPSLLQIYLPSTATNEDVALYGESLDVYIITQAIGTNVKFESVSQYDQPFTDDSVFLQWLSGLMKSAVDALTKDDTEN